MPEIKGLEYYTNYLTGYKKTWIFEQFIHLPYNIIGLFTGNQAMKTSGCAYQYVMRIHSHHPVPEKNVLYFECPNKHKFNAVTLPKEWICPICKSEIKMHERGSRVFRFASEVLPGEKASVSEGGLSAEVKNSVYPEFKKWLPRNLLKRDITYRNMAMIIADPLKGQEFCGEIYKGEDIIVELVAYSQTVQSTAGKQRLSCWEDEEPPYDFHEEQMPRLMAENGDCLLSLTPANKLSWTYDEIFERANVYIRSKTIVDYLTTKDYKPKEIEYTDSPYSIAVIQAATDDNPTLTQEAIEEKMSSYDDPDIIATRRFGVHKQIKGRIFKGFDYAVHFIEKEKYFPDNIPVNWTHGRGIDYHSQTNWACGSIALSPQNEAFIYAEYNPSPEKLTTREICRDFAIVGSGYKYILNLIDPFAEAVKKDTISILQDINQEFYRLYKEENIGYHAYWLVWDVKGEKGRDAIRERLKNSIRVGEPFKNRVTEKGKEIFLPTLWILNNCKISAKHMRMWRWEEYTEPRVAIQKGEKNKPQQKHSHFNMVWEGLFKNPAFRPKHGGLPRKERKVGYFQGR